MNKLNTEERRKVVACLVEGNSLRATTRITGVPRYDAAQSPVQDHSVR